MASAGELVIGTTGFTGIVFPGLDGDAVAVVGSVEPGAIGCNGAVCADTGVGTVGIGAEDGNDAAGAAVVAGATGCAAVSLLARYLPNI